MAAQDQPVISIEDDLGRTVTLPVIPEHVVSLAPSITETLFAIGAGDQVAGITQFCDFPPEALDKPRVGGMINPNYELIVSVDPDLVNRSFDIGALTGHLEGAENVAQELRRRLQHLLETPKLMPKPKVLFLVSIQPIITAGKGTFMDELLSIAGGENAGRASNISYPLLNREQIFAARPDVMLVLSDAAKSVESVVERFPEWRSLPAVRDRRVYLIDADPISRPGPRILDGLETVFELLRQ